MFGAVGFLALYGLGILLAPSDLFLRLQSNIAYNLPALIVLPLVLRRRRSADLQERRGWTAMAVMLGAWFIGDCIYSVNELVFSRAPWYPGFPDLAYVIGSAAFLVGLALLTYPSGVSTRLQSLLDALLLTVLAACLQWQFVMAPLFDQADATFGETAVSILYPMADLALCAIILGAAFASGGRLSKRSVILMAGGVLLVVADSIYVTDLMGDGYDNSGNPLELAWLAFYFSIGLAALVGGDKETGRQSEGVPLLWLAAPYALALPLPLLLALRVFPHAESTLVLGSAGVLLIVFLKQVVTLVESSRAIAAERRLSRFDGLTGVLNRRAIIEEIEQCIAEGSSRFALALVDLDQLKAVNDEFGHGTGDVFLKTVATRLSAEGRLTGRYGGDEFLVVGLVRDDADVKLFEACLHGSLESAALDLEDGRTISVSASVGVAIFPEHGRDVASLLQVADMAMYLQKQEYRRHVIESVPLAPLPAAIKPPVAIAGNPAA
jgi:diguanylate cyclase (GGDEF)-like protein